MKNNFEINLRDPTECFLGAPFVSLRLLDEIHSTLEESFH